MKRRVGAWPVRRRRGCGRGGVRGRCGEPLSRRREGAGGLRGSGPLCPGKGGVARRAPGSPGAVGASARNGVSEVLGAGGVRSGAAIYAF